MKSTSPLVLAVLVCIFLTFSFAISHSPSQHKNRGAIKIQDHTAVAHNATLHRRNNINKYGGCKKKYKHGKDGKTESTGRDIVDSGYKDMLRMTKNINNFLRFWIINLGTGKMEKRFFGDVPIGSKKRKLIQSKSNSLISKSL
jgi:hypothetical protein